MPAGKTHEKINFFSLYILVFMALLIISYVFYGFFGVILLTLFFIGYLFGTYMFGPDLDLPSRPFYRWKHFRFIWKPYQKMISHRSIWSHGFIIGDAVRVIYLSFCFLPFYLLFLAFTKFSFIETTGDIFSFIILHYPYFLSPFLGIVLASSLHILSDMISTSMKKRKNNKKKKKK